MGAGPAHVNAIIANLVKDPLQATVAHGFKELEAVMQDSRIDLRRHMQRMDNALPNDPHQAIGATKEMLETIMKTILDRLEQGPMNRLKFRGLTSLCLMELGLKGSSSPAIEAESNLRGIASSAEKMINHVNEPRNQAGTGHGRAEGKEPEVTPADASLVVSVGCSLAAWLLRHEAALSGL